MLTVVLDTTYIIDRLPVCQLTGNRYTVYYNPNQL
jgi:hypothetical protein